MDFEMIESPRRPVKRVNTTTPPPAPKKTKSGNVYTLNLTPRKLFKGDMTVVYNGTIRDISVIGSNNGLLKVIDHSSQTNNFKYFCIEKLKQENPDLTYFKYRSVYEFDIF
jgi:hypothetical protein